MSTLRKTLEDAYAASDTPPPSETPAPSETPVAESSAPAEDKAPAVDKTPSSAPEQSSEAAAEEPPAPKTKNFDLSRPPVSWKSAAKAKWNEVPLEAKMEAHRRDAEITAALNASANARKLEQAFHQAFAPYEAHLKARGAPNALVAAQELIKADYILTTAPPHKRAQFMAQLIKDYGIDLHALDSALAGQMPDDSLESRVEALLQERLKPIHSFLQVQAQTAQQHQAIQQQKIQEQLEAMANNTEKYPYFDTVREDMADIIEMQAKRGVYLTLDQAYTRAVAINPEISAQVNAAQEAEQQRKAAAAAHARAAKAKSASVSVSGAPNGTPSGSAKPADLRSTIEAAFNQASGR